MELRVLIRQAAGKDVAVRKEGIKVRHNGIVTDITIEVIAFRTRDSGERHFLVIFEDRIAPTARDSKKSGNAQAKIKGRSQEDQVAPLARELAATQQHLKSIIAENEASTEELKALNEEVQSSNEELQSINEELETSKEELQSTNEELNTVNDELQNRNEEITESNNDLLNVLSGVEIPILLIGNKLQIRRFNASAGKALNLIATDIGRPVSDIRPNINVPDLDRMILEVIDSLTIGEQEVQDKQGRWYSMTIRPYKTIDNRIDGAIVTLEDINSLKLGTLRIQEARDYADAIVETVREPLIVLSKDLRVVTANQAYYKSFQATPEAVENKFFYELQDGRWNVPMLRSLLEDILEKNTFFNDFVVDNETSDIGRRIMLLNARRVVREGSEAPLILLPWKISPRGELRKRSGTRAILIERKRFPRSRSWLECCRSALRARRYAMTRVIGSRSRPISEIIPRRNSATASVPSVRSSFIRNTLRNRGRINNGVAHRFRQKTQLRALPDAAGNLFDPIIS
ncbi:MAG: PAS domain-containing protein [Nitrospirota bacterium]